MTVGEWLKDHTQPTAQPVERGVGFGESVGHNHRAPDWVGVRVVNRTVTFVLSLLFEHFLVIGETGSGKTYFLKWLILIIARFTDWDIFVVDGKGDAGFALDVANIIYRERNGHATPIAFIGHEENEKSEYREWMHSPYNAFEGTSMTVKSRIDAMLGLEEMSGNAHHYAIQYRGMLHLVCDSPLGPPRSLRELADRSRDSSWCKRAWAGNPTKVSDADKFNVRDGGWHDFYLRIIEYESAIGRYIDSQGFSLRTCRTAVFSIVKTNIFNQADQFMDTFTLSLTHFMTSLQMRPAVLIVDELGVFDKDKGSSKNRKTLLKVGRSQEMGMITAAQTYTSLGDEVDQTEYKHLSTTRFLMSFPEPEFMLNTVGTEDKQKTSVRVEKGGATDSGTVTTQKEYRIDPVAVRQLPRGEGFLMRKGYYWHIKIPNTPKLHKIPREEQAVAVFKQAEEPPTTAEAEAPVKMVKMPVPKGR